VEAVAGRMSVRSPRGEGTVLLVQMPLSAEWATEAGGQPQSYRLGGPDPTRTADARGRVSRLEH
jgi:hypothetical protein